MTDLFDVDVLSRSATAGLIGAEWDWAEETAEWDGDVRPVEMWLHLVDVHGLWVLAGLGVSEDVVADVLAGLDEDRYR